MSQPSATLDLPQGTQVGEYQIVGLLGRGGMGTVYQGVHPQIGKRVAIKVLGAHVDEEMTARFQREAQVVNRIGHPGLVDIFSFGRLPGGRYYLVMELLPGEALANRLMRGPFPWPHFLDLFLQLLAGLQAAHEGGVVHRDLKPENIFLVSGREPPQVKILDFGLAKDQDAEVQMTATGIALGTPRYMAPEQSRGGRHVDHRADLYAVGLIMYEAVTGKFPFDAPSPILMLTMHLTQQPQAPSQLAVLPPALEQVILRALTKTPAERYENAREMADALRAVGPPSAPIELRRLPPPSATEPQRSISPNLPRPLPPKASGGVPRVSVNLPSIGGEERTRVTSSRPVRAVETPSMPAAEMHDMPAAGVPAAAAALEVPSLTPARPRYLVPGLIAVAVLGVVVIAVVALHGPNDKGPTGPATGPQASDPAAGKAAEAGGKAPAAQVAKTPPPPATPDPPPKSKKVKVPKKVHHNKPRGLPTLF